MAKTWSCAAVAVISFVLVDGVGAQVQTVPGAGAQQPDTVKVTGCLQQRGSMAPAGSIVGTSGVTPGPTTGTPGTSTAGFMLLNARAGMGGGGTAAPDATAKTSSAKSGASDPSTGAGSLTGNAATPPAPGATVAADNQGVLYYLDGQISQLRDHVGHQVEITGSLALASGSAATGRTGATTPDANSSGLLARGATDAGSSAAAARLEVQSVRMIAPNCSSR